MKQMIGKYSLETRTRKSGAQRFAVEWWEKRHHHSKVFPSAKERKEWLQARMRESKGVASVRAAAARAGDYVSRFSRLDLDIQNALLGAWDRVRAAGGGVADISKAAEDATAALGGGVTISEAVAVHLANAKRWNRPKTVQHKAEYLADLTAKMGSLNLCTLSRAACREWVESGDTPWIVRHRHAVLSAFLNDCVRREWLRDTPMRGLQKPPPPIAENVAIFTADEAERYMRAAERIARQSVAHFAVALFAGLRPQREVPNLKDQFINLDDGMIYVSKWTVKTAQSRSVPISPNLRAWLMAYPFKDSVPYSREQRTRVAAEAGVTLANDIFRHTCASFRLALTRNPAQTADEMGHSLAVLHSHYANRRIPPADVKHFWSILPFPSN